MPSDSGAMGAPDPTRGNFVSTVACMAMAQLLAWAALYYTFSTVVLPMQETLGWSKSDIMGAFTLGLAMWGAGSYAAGSAIDRGHGRWVMAGGTLLAGLGFLLWSQVTHLAALYLVWAMLGLSMAMCLYEPAFSIVTRRFPTRYATAITWLTLVGGFASTLSFPVTLWMLESIGWRHALTVIGLVMVFVATPLNAWALRGGEARRVVSVDAKASDATLHQALRRRTFWLLGATFMLYSLVSATFWAHVMPAFAFKGTPEGDALLVLMWVGPAQVIGRLLFFVGGKGITTRALGIGVFASVPVAMSLFALTNSLWCLLLFAALFGAANGLVTIVRGHVVPVYFGHTNVGRISGAMSVMTLMPRAAGPLIGAWALLALSDYGDLILGLAGVSALACAAFMAVGRPPKHHA